MDALNHSHVLTKSERDFFGARTEFVTLHMGQLIAKLRGKDATERPLVIALVPEETLGPLNNFVGFANVLQNQLGHRVVFVLDASGKGKASRYGFEEELFDSSKKSDDDDNDDGDESFDEFINRSLPEFRKAPMEQWKTFSLPVLKKQIGIAKRSNEQITALLEKLEPDVIVQDIYAASPAVINNTAGVPFIRIISSNPLGIPDARKKPPVYSGVSAEYSSSVEIAECWCEYDAIFRPLWTSFNKWVQAHDCLPLPDLDFVQPSPYLNIYIYPEAIDYQREWSREDRALWRRVNSCVRDVDPEFELPVKLRQSSSTTEDSPLIYVSLGTLGCEDIDLMKKLICILGRTEYRCIFSLGPKHAKFEPLPDNIWGKEAIPQTRVIPQVDLVITHGGNNTVTDCFHFGKPMIVMPMFWDQHDNATRIAETGYGIHLDTYTFTEAQLNEAIVNLLSNDQLKRKLTIISEQVQVADGVTEVAREVERIAKQFRK